MATELASQPKIRLLHSVARRDLMWLGIASVVTYLLAGELDLFERVFELAEVYEDYELDELITCALIGFFGLLVFMFRRTNEFRAALQAYEEATRRVQFLALHDPLTGLANRRKFEQRLAEELSRSRRTGGNFALLLLDVDHFKAVNDLLGHDAGDTVLVEFATRMSRALRDVDLAARLGGDEFAILQLDIDQPKGATALARRLRDVLAEPYPLGHETARVSASIGVAIVDPEAVSDAETLIKNADVALYRAKNEGRATFRFYATDMDTALLERRRLELELREAFTNNALELHFQQQHRVADHELLGYEALLRWRHPERGLVPPDEFIALAEDSGLIVPITHWVIAQACVAAAEWPEHLSVAVNVSATHLRGDDLVGCVARSLGDAKLAPSRLELEVTEGVLVDRADFALETLSKLHRMGVRLALDDFGKGSSSLSHLLRFPFDRIKIDRSFVANVTTDDNAQRIVGAVVELANSLGCDVMAEGVETECQLAWLSNQRCLTAQGFLFGRPTPRSELRPHISSSMVRTIDRRSTTA